MDRPYGTIFKGFRGRLLEDEPLAGHTALKVGGKADVMAFPEDLDELRQLYAGCCEQSVKCLVIGGGYNLLVRDNGLRGVVISLKKLKAVERLPGNRVKVQAGVSNQRLVKCLELEGLSGLEFLSGIPGSIGGALAMNAGCHGHEIMAALESLTTLGAGGLQETAGRDLEYGYRFLNLAEGAVIVEALFQLTADDPTAISVRVAEFIEKRRVSQQVGYPNAGSFFKNPPNASAWRLIDAAGLRGTTVGGAQVSEQHANFLVNRGGATAHDFLELAALVKERVRAQSGVVLEEEVRIVGEE
ncbi:UDP-N-acetylenolpyruvoylglucosamine reductase [Geobacter sp. OR-1]|uniref:UDP-N-acetylmuramate dehydrogenase n=1 Tax=Geobacter sp. OR-1 TaxID=1266765 RepID=UPI000542F847|nr:UDP-N-acetylmuramate dehydrogenase [Geobacter sp. OR-1]GAM09510.1 UDP-N-acetylenolpyruvoylglucosamine reductase [Geobacter sp. OR-1]